MKTIDLRSDTVTHPTPAMRTAMYEAEVGDDVWGDDPTVIKLQEYAADLLGKEAALYLPSATQGNIIAALTHCGRGDELIVGKQSHMFQWEAGGAAVLGGISMSQIPVQPDGTLRLEDITANIRNPRDPHHPLSRLICLENTHGGVGGVPITPEYTAHIGEWVHANGFSLHIDGARLFNAAAALNVHPRELVRHADSVQICLSKGLCAPVGALILGSKAFIDRAARNRKILGGGMRQAGVIAAAGLVALRDMRERLRDDHATAHTLADGLADIPGFTVHPVHRRTNMVFFSVDERINSAELVDALRAKDIILNGGPHFRAVTHYWITPERIQAVLDAIRVFVAEHAIAR